MKLPVDLLDAAETDAVYSSMEEDVQFHSNTRTFSKNRTRNVGIESDEGYNEKMLRSASFSTRTPAKLRLSFNKSQGSDIMTDEQVCIGENSELSERRRSLFEPLGPKRNLRDRSPESFLPPPDFETASYPRGWVVGKKRKLVNVDVVESMRRIAVHEMNRKDREIDGLSEQLEEDARTMEHLQVQLLQERQKRVQTERENSVLKDQVSMLMNMLDELEEGAEAENLDDSQLTNN